MDIWRCDMQVWEKKQIQRGDMFEKYKHNFMGVKEQLNWLNKGNWTVLHDLWRDMIKKRHKLAKIVRIISVHAAVRVKDLYILR
jgi:DNA integrity scanning protein DisA with diadenylate cyclase activity